MLVFLYPPSNKLFSRCFSYLCHCRNPSNILSKALSFLDAGFPFCNRLQDHALIDLNCSFYQLATDIFCTPIFCCLFLHPFLLPGCRTFMSKVLLETFCLASFIDAIPPIGNACPSITPRLFLPFHHPSSFLALQFPPVS